MNTSGRRGLAWLAFLVVTIVALRSAATGMLDGPPLTSLGALTDWGEARDPTTTALALVRFSAELLAWYLFGLTLLYGAASVLRSGGTAALADALALPGARRLVRTGLGLGLLASTAAGATPDEQATAPAPSTAMMQPEPVGSTERGTARMVPEHASDVATGRGTDERATRATATAIAPTPTTWTVDAGESFWSIAHDVLADVLGREPSDAEVDPYWRALVERNRGRLVDRDDPDLIHPGQVFELPPTS